jgi:class 3 adenylate cyclase
MVVDSFKAFPTRSAKMIDKSSQVKVPMRKHTSCINILTCANYIKHILSEVPHDRLFHDVVGNGQFLITEEDTGKIEPVSQDFLLKARNWVSNRLLNTVYQNTVAILKDPDAIYKAGRNIPQNALGTQFFLMRLAGPQTIIQRLPKENAKFNRNRSIEIIENRNGFATVRIYWNNDPWVTKLFCDMNKGVYEGFGKLTKNPATVEEKICQFDGGDFCEYNIRWKAKPFYARFLDLFRIWISHKLIRELENKIEEINDIRIKQERIIELRTQDLEKEKEKVVQAHNILSRYVAPQLAKKIIEGQVDAVWGHRRRKLSMFFSDIKNFTLTTDTMEPEDMANLLNEYFANMNAIIQKYGGTLAHIIGDAMFVFFGAPDKTNDQDHALRCVQMAIGMQQKMKQLQHKWFDEGIEHPLQIRCGINTGMASVGGYGSAERKEYTAMGMQVNLASRLESACEPGGILISHPTWALIKDTIKCVAKGQIEVKGFSRPVKVYAVDFRKVEG